MAPPVRSPLEARENSSSMSDKPVDTRDALVRAIVGLPSAASCDAALKAGGLPIEDRTRAIYENEILQIRHELAFQVSSKNRPKSSETCARLVKNLANLCKELRSDAAGEVFREMVVLSLTRSALDVSKFIKETEDIRDALMDHLRVYSSYKKRKRIKLKHLDLEDWLFEKLYCLCARLKGAQFGNSIGGPLYRFTIESANLLGVNVVITPGAFRKRRNDRSESWWKGIEKLRAIQ